MYFSIGGNLMDKIKGQDELIRKDTAKHIREIRVALRHSSININTIVDDILWIFAIAIIMIAMCILFDGCAQAANTPTKPIIEGYSLNQWANSIHHAEGNDNYGILSVKCATTESCRRICKNTVRHIYKRWLRSKQNIPFLLFLGKRYCPLGASNDHFGRNRFWIKNVNYWLMKG